MSNEIEVVEAIKFKELKYSCSINEADLCEDEKHNSRCISGAEYLWTTKSYCISIALLGKENVIRIGVVHKNEGKKSKTKYFDGVATNRCIQTLMSVINSEEMAKIWKQTTKLQKLLIYEYEHGSEDRVG